jgi:hypothetical protein
VGFPAASAIGRIHRGPDLLQEGDDGLHEAVVLRLGDLERRIRGRVESVRQGARRVHPWSAMVGTDTLDDLQRGHQISSRLARRLLTRGQLLAVLARKYRLDLDPLAQEARPRRMPDTKDLPHSRTVAAEVKREILRRSGGFCEFGSCERPGAESCHLKPHRDGSGREADDLALGCKLHHTLHDEGLLRHCGWSSDGRPAFVVLETGRMPWPKPRPTEDETPAWPVWLLRAVGRDPGRARRPGKRPRKHRGKRRGKKPAKGRSTGRTTRARSPGKPAAPSPARPPEGTGPP